MHKYLLLISTLAILLFACKKEEIKDADINNIVDNNDTIDNTDSTETLVCNGFSELCNKKYNEVSYATTHNAHAIQGPFSDLAANQDLTILEQLNLGIRCLNIKSYWTDDSSCGPEGHYLYHGLPVLGCTPLSDLLDDVKSWLDDNPNEVLTFTIEPGASVAQLEQSFNNAGLKQFMFQHTYGEEWPTLKNLIESGKRLVVFTSKGSQNDNYEGFHDYWEYTFDTDYRAASRTDFDCDKYRGNSAGDLFLLNHFLTNTTPQFDSAQYINEKNYLLLRAEACALERGKQPNFVMIDFVGQGDVISVVNALNGVD